MTILGLYAGKRLAEMSLKVRQDVDNNISGQRWRVHLV
jgi:hypothetical protein